jgi:hypothetical protein
MRVRRAHERWRRAPIGARGLVSCSRPALFAGGKAISQLWLFIVVPPVGAYLAGLLFKLKMLED